MPEISRFLGIIIRMFYDEHNPPHLHAEYSGKKVLVDFNGNVLAGDLGSRVALRLVREWIDMHVAELMENWEWASSGTPLKKIAPLD
jgi:hypothetical protein